MAANLFHEVIICDYYRQLLALIVFDSDDLVPLSENFRVGVNGGTKTEWKIDLSETLFNQIPFVFARLYRYFGFIFNCRKMYATKYLTVAISEGKIISLLEIHFKNYVELCKIIQLINI